MGKFKSLTIHDTLDRNMLPLAEVITRLPFTWSDYSCGGHLDIDTPPDLQDHMRISNGTIFIGIYFDLTHPGVARCIQLLEVYMASHGEYGLISSGSQNHSQKSISIKFIPREFIQEIIVKEAGGIDADRIEKYIPGNQVRMIYRNNQKIIRELTTIFSSFLTESDSLKVIQRTSDRMNEFLMRNRHET